MKTVSVDNLPLDFLRALSEASRERIVLTRAGKPVGVVVGVENVRVDELDDADGGIPLEEDPQEFWRMIQERRKETEFVSLEEVVARIEAEAQGAK